MNADERQRARIDAELATPLPGQLRREIDPDTEFDEFTKALTGMSFG